MTLTCKSRSSIINLLTLCIYQNIHARPRTVTEVCIFMMCISATLCVNAVFLECIFLCVLI